jgi:lysophospholipase L1-like esterase
MHDVGPYMGRLKAMAGLIRAMGAEPVFITQRRGDAMVIDGRLQGLAATDGLNGLDEHRGLAQFNAATLRVCGELKITCADLAHDIRFEPEDFYDRIHYTPKGAEKIGRWLAGKIGPLLK